MTRDEALQRLQSENKLYMDEIELLLDQAGFEDSSFFSQITDGFNA
jgi:hypothetical protein